MRKIEILIVVVLLLALACLFGCKDEVEAMTWSHTDEEPPQAVWYYDGENTIRYLPEPVEIEGKDGGEKGILRVLSDGDDNYIELHHDDTDGVDAIIDPNEYVIIEPYSTETTYTDISFIYENNGDREELTVNVIDGEIVCSQPPKKAIEIIVKMLCQQYNIREVENWPVRFEEPNEPEREEYELSGMIYIGDPNESQKVSLDFIPTWPDYIELEKDLYIAIPNRDGISAIKQWKFDKGTKIYFKD